MLCLRLFLWFPYAGGNWRLFGPAPRRPVPKTALIKTELSTKQEVLLMDYKALYQSKLTTPEEAVKCVQSGDWVAWGWVTNTPKACDHAAAS